MPPKRSGSKGKGKGSGGGVRSGPGALEKPPNDTAAAGPMGAPSLELLKASNDDPAVRVAPSDPGTNLPVQQKPPVTASKQANDDPAAADRISTPSSRAPGAPAIETAPMGSTSPPLELPSKLAAAQKQPGGTDSAAGDALPGAEPAAAEAQPEAAAEEEKYEDAAEEAQPEAAAEETAAEQAAAEEAQPEPAAKEAQPEGAAEEAQPEAAAEEPAPEAAAEEAQPEPAAEEAATEEAQPEPAAEEAATEEAQPEAAQPELATEEAQPEPATEEAKPEAAPAPDAKAGAEEAAETAADEGATATAAAPAAAPPAAAEPASLVPAGPPPRRAAPLAAEHLPGGAAAAAQLPEAALRALGAFRELYIGAGGEADREAVLKGSYSEAAVFDDNIVRVVGPGHIGVQFYALARLCKKSSMDIISVEVVPAADVVSPLSARAAALLAPALRAAGGAGELLRGAVGGVAWAGAGGSGGLGGLIGIKVVNRQRYWLPWPVRNLLSSAFVPEYVDLWVTSWLLAVGGDGEEAGTVLEHRDHWHNILKAPWVMRRALGFWSSWAMKSVLGW